MRRSDMTIDLDELERKARLSNEQFDLWADTFPDWHVSRLHPRVVLALIERVRESEQRLSKMCDRHMDEKRKRMDYQERVKDLTS